jgi:hypothetical protein
MIVRGVQLDMFGWVHLTNFMKGGEASTLNTTLTMSGTNPVRRPAGAVTSQGSRTNISRKESPFTLTNDGKESPFRKLHEYRAK